MLGWYTGVHVKWAVQCFASTLGSDCSSATCLYHRRDCQGIFDGQAATTFAMRQVSVLRNRGFVDCKSLEA